MSFFSTTSIAFMAEGKRTQSMRTEHDAVVFPLPFSSQSRQSKRRGKGRNRLLMRRRKRRRRHHLPERMQPR